MIPYLIAGAIGFVVAKLFEEDESPKYDDGGLMLEEYNDLIDLAKESDYNDFLDETDELSKYYILYRGMDSWDEWTNDSFMGNFLSHAKEYGEFVDGIIIDDSNSEIMYFDNYTFNQLRKNITKLILPSKPMFFEAFNEYKEDFVEKLKEIYKPYFDEGKLYDAMDYLNYNEDDIINFVFNFVFNSTENFEEYSIKKDKDFFVPLLTYYAKSKGYNIISFYGGDFGGSDEFVVNDISKYITLSDIWKSVDGNNHDELFNSSDDYADGGSVLLAPNGKPSNLTPEQYKLVRTPAFKEWFGDWEKDPANASKVVDENREPLICYHTTDYLGEINVFNFSEEYSFQQYGFGVYFTDDKKHSESYFEGEKYIVYEVFLNLKNPIILNQKEKGSNKKSFLINREKNNKAGAIIYYPDRRKWNYFIAGEPNQIKLADGSNTTFDSNNPDIRYAGGGDIEKYKIFNIQKKGNYINFYIGNNKIGYVEYYYYGGNISDNIEIFHDEFYMAMIELYEEYRGKNYSEIMIEYIKDYAKSLGATIITLRVDYGMGFGSERNPNYGLEKIYLKNGFKYSFTEEEADEDDTKDLGAMEYILDK